mmetsp:Transcript_9319/g.17756  ORF Transcript_9319/g.17756 Transcript_9319/m.17756 type:complete len:362 (-) Transcript_9319:134-1219(-)
MNSMRLLAQITMLASLFVRLHASPAFISTNLKLPVAASMRATRLGLRMEFGSTSYSSLDDVELESGKDYLISALSENLEVSVKVLSARELVQEAVVKQQLQPLATDALGRTMLCALLMSNGLKDQETLQLNFAGDGPLGGIMAISDGDAGVRGYVQAPSLKGLPPLPTGNQDVAFGIGRGVLRVVRNHPTYARPYNGVVEIQSGEVAYDCAYYLKQSEQKASGIGAGVRVEGALVGGAAGYMVEMLPGASLESEAALARNVQALLQTAQNPCDLLKQGWSLKDVLTQLTDGLGRTQINVVEPRYQCQCGVEKVYRTLRLLGKAEVQKILDEEEEVEVKCEFCGKVYCLDHAEIRKEMSMQE